MQDQTLESAKREMGEARKENERLKLSLARVAKDYQTMHMHFFDIIQQDKQEEVTKAVGAIDSHEENEESELVSLSLGISSKGQPILDEKRNSNRTKMIKEDEDLTLSLGLNTTFDPPGAGEGKELEDLTEKWPPSKVLKTARTGDISEGPQHTQLKKTRVCIRARCDTQTMNDGCQWRKYGQKMAKGNPCPRGYYRCTVSPTCLVKKQVQRCAEDTSILITTYEGTHNHPLHTSATAIAYTTSAAASMIQSPSLSSQQLGLANSDTFPIVNSNVAYNLNALNHTSTCYQQFSTPQQLHFHNSSISSSNSHPTVILDLTAPQTSFHIGKFTPAFSSTLPKHPSTNLNFSSTITSVQSSMLHSTWSPCSGHFNYGGLIAQNRNQYGSLMNNGKQSFQGHLYQPNYMSNHAISQQPLTDSTEATTKAITTNPKFQPAIAASLTTYVGNGATCGGVMENHVVAESAALNLQLGGDMSYTKNTVYTTSSQNGIGCASSRYLSMSSTASNTQKGNMFKSSTASNGATCGGVMENHVVAESAALNVQLGGDMPYTKNTIYTTSSQNGIGCASSRYLSLSSTASNTQKGNMFKSSTASNAQKGNMFKSPPSLSSKSSFGSPSNISNQLLWEKK